jgi:hypothetical protein
VSARRASTRAQTAPVDLLCDPSTGSHSHSFIHNSCRWPALHTSRRRHLNLTPSVLLFAACAPSVSAASQSTVPVLTAQLGNLWPAAAPSSAPLQQAALPQAQPRPPPPALRPPQPPIPVTRVSQERQSPSASTSWDPFDALPGTRVMHPSAAMSTNMGSGPVQVASQAHTGRAEAPGWTSQAFGGPPVLPWPSSPSPPPIQTQSEAPVPRWPPAGTQAAGAATSQPPQPRPPSLSFAQYPAGHQARGVPPSPALEWPGVLQQPQAASASVGDQGLAFDPFAAPPAPRQPRTQTDPFAPQKS